MPRPAGVVLLRHGETEWSRERRHTGRTDVPLTERGREDARHAGRALRGERFARVLVSPLRRARDTAVLAGVGDVAEVDDDLVEWDYGDYEGMTAAQIRTARPGWSPWKGGFPGGETVEQVGARADRVLVGAADVEGTVLLVAHGHLLRILGARWLGLPPRSGALLGLDTAALCRLGWEREQRQLGVWNDTSHLAPDGIRPPE